jgi:hypothetical protein
MAHKTRPQGNPPETDRAAYEAAIERLSKASVEKHWEPMVDIPWDDPEFAVDPTDPRWELPTSDPLSAHPWYLAQPPEKRAEIGLWRVATAMKVGLQFENLLKRGLLTYAYRLPNGSPEFRYAYHETIEEGHHGMMLQEFVNRTGLPVRGMPRRLDRLAQVTPWIPRISTELFFVFVLGGEDPIDHTQRRMLRENQCRHPLQEQIMRIHVAEEARHISFARTYLRRRVPRLGRGSRLAIALLAPVILGIMARIMLDPPGPMVRRFQIPDEVLDEAYRKNPEWRAELRRSLDKVRRLAVELGLVDRVSVRIWRAMGIWSRSAEQRATS